MDLLKEVGSINRPPLLDATNYGYRKAKMSTFIKLIDEKAWISILQGWKSPTKIDTEGKTIPKDKED